MGTDISDEDMDNIIYLCDQVIAIAEYRTQLYDYLKARMNAVAPNLTCMVGELVGARLISHAGSLLNLAKYPASTGMLCACWSCVKEDAAVLLGIWCFAALCCSVFEAM